MRSHDSAPAAKGTYPAIHQTDTERQSGLLAKVHWLNFIKTSAVIEGVAGIAALALKEPEVAALGGVAIAWMGGEALHDTHNYYRNGFRPNYPVNKLVKAMDNETFESH